jgi:hypothetical protein
MDFLLWGRAEPRARRRGRPKVGLDTEAVEAAYWEIGRRREATAYLHAPAVALDERGATG